MNEKLIDDAGKVRFGLLGNSVSKINIDDFWLRKPRGGQASAWNNWVGFKQFQYFGAVSEQLLFGCAIAHLRHTAIAFIYLYHPQHGMLLEISRRIPLGIGVTLSNDTTNGCSRFHAGNLAIELNHQGERKSLSVTLGKRLHIDAWFTEVDYQPLGIASRIGRNGWAYARKVAGVSCHGSIQLDSQKFDLTALNSFAHHDFSAGFLRRETFWNWACLSGRNQHGDRIGLNLSCGVNETSFSENAVWLNGQLHHLGLCYFDYDWDRPEQPWQITSEDGSVSLCFTPHGSHQQRLNLLLFASDFKQLFGQFNGQIRLSNGTNVPVDGLWGFVEDQYAKW
ncbi:DUF2804 domain-containing protein [Ferrimonas lipolytica]|uniref:DUF2804 domain-containing protein n=1 Tax=Ferrimonas lipolytica TaxID=2724191 RepID=A0A6H1UEV5_9GAMM|nr:DUF2804 domain-containing protein [Ferrimonas lipolytica]QIZ77625.1 DUF2804 domain-containing protein [Ferrimonas lipolytica]